MIRCQITWSDYTKGLKPGHTATAIHLSYCCLDRGIKGSSNLLFEEGFLHPLRCMGLFCWNMKVWLGWRSWIRATSRMSIPLRVFDTVFNNNINLVELCHALCCIPVEFWCDSVDGSLLSQSVYLVLSHRIDHHHTQTHRAQRISPFERRDVPMATANTLTMIINYCSSLPALLSAGKKGTSMHKKQ